MCVTNVKRYCLALDLFENHELIQEYDEHHKTGNVWPEIIEGIKDCNILDMEIYRCGNRLFMILETNEQFDLKKDFEKMKTLPKQQEWAELMLKFQKKLSFADKDEHWVLMSKIFDLNNGKL